MSDIEKRKRDDLPVLLRPLNIGIAIIFLTATVLLSGFGGAQMMQRYIAEQPTPTVEFVPSSTPLTVYVPHIVIATPYPIPTVPLGGLTVPLGSPVVAPVVATSTPSPGQYYDAMGIRHVDVPCSSPQQVISELENGGIIVFDCAKTVVFDYQVKIDSPTTLIGRSAEETILSGNSTTKSLMVVGPGPLTLRNVTIEGATEGAVYLNASGIADFENCVFRNNTRVITEPVQWGLGAALINSGAVTLKSCAFYSNQASFGGAAIQNIKGSYGSGVLTGEDLIFESNSTSSEAPLLGGGAIYNQGEMTLTNTTFKDNWAQQGASLYNVGSLMLIEARFTYASQKDETVESVITNGGTMTLKGSITFDGPIQARTDIYNSGQLDSSEAEINSSRRCFNRIIAEHDMNITC